MKNILAEIAEYKRVEYAGDFATPSNLPRAERDFASALKSSGRFPRLIAEIKPASPVKGPILPAGTDIAVLAQTFEENGVAAISVLTDSKYFGGSFENLRLAKQATKTVPIFCKDFIISEKQIKRARAYGADSFLLIAKILTVAELQALLDAGRRLGMEALVEIADDDDLAKLLQSDAQIVGINNRDLTDFSVDIKRTFLLAKKLPPSMTIVSLSGFQGADIRLVKKIVHAVLVGTAIGKAPDPAQRIRDYLQPKILLKACGVRTAAGIELAEHAGADLVGFNFVPTSKRYLSVEAAENLKTKLKRAFAVGVFQNQPADEVQSVCRKTGMQFVQLSGDERADDFRDYCLPIIKAIRISENNNFMQELHEWNAIADIFLFDGREPGSGKPFLHHLLPGTTKPFLVAGGINPANAANIIAMTHPDGIDTASGIENEKGEWEEEKIRALKMAADGEE